MSNPTISDIQIAKDHHATLIATLFQSKQSMKATVVLAPATAIKRQFYQNFAQFLADNGYGELPLTTNTLVNRLMATLPNPSLAD